MRQILFLAITVLILSSCGNNPQKEADQLLHEARALFEQGQYDAARVAIDSLRRTYPNIVEARRGALALHQEIELKVAQEELLSTDSLLQIANRKLEALQEQVDANKKALRATPEELTLLTRTRIWRDSIRTQYETLGAKIRYIRQKQEDSTPKTSDD